MIVDLIIIILMVIFVLNGKRKGLIRSVYSVLSLALSMLLVYMLRGLFTDFVANSSVGISISEYIASSVGEEAAAICSAAVISVLSLIVLYFLVGIILRTTVGLLDFIAKLPILNSLNKLLGMVFGAVVGMLWIFVFVNVAYFIPDFNELIKDSYIIEVFESFVSGSIKM